MAIPSTRSGPTIGPPVHLASCAQPAGHAEILATIRSQFPILSETVHDNPLVYLDSGASAQKPRVVIDAMVHAMERQYSNVHRGLHWMSEKATESYEEARDLCASLMNAKSRDEIIFVRNATEAINLVAQSFGRHLMRPDQAIIISEMEHHSNIVPWQLLRTATGIELRVAPVTDDGEFDFPAFEGLLSDGKVGLVAITHMSNVLGSYLPVERLIASSHAAGSKVLLDGAQAVVHRKVDVQKLDCDFYVWSAHKLYGPTGIGVLWAKEELLEAMPPFLGGGDMISSVSFEHTTWAPLPHKFEAGTPAIVEGTGLAAAVRFVQSVGYDFISAHEAELTSYALTELRKIEGLRIFGQSPDRGGVISFALGNAHPHDLATLLDRRGVAIRAGQHCAEPLMRRFGVTSTARASFAAYTTKAEIDILVTSLQWADNFIRRAHG